ncbi:unnamed protein product, partial [Effrenium voratum]
VLGVGRSVGRGVLGVGRSVGQGIMRRAQRRDLGRRAQCGRSVGREVLGIGLERRVSGPGVPDTKRPAQQPGLAR